MALPAPAPLRAPRRRRGTWNLRPLAAVDNSTTERGSRWQAPRKDERRSATSARRKRRGEACARVRTRAASPRVAVAPSHDPQAQVGRLSPLFAQAEPEDRPAPQSRHLQDTGGGREARARRAVLQAPLKRRSRVDA